MISKVNNDLVLEEMLQRKKDIVIYGAGRYGKTTKRYLEKKYDVKTVKFAVSASENISEAKVEGVAVTTIGQITDKDVNLVIAVSEQHQNALIKLAVQSGFTHIYTILNEYLRYMDVQLDSDHLIPLGKIKFEVHITEHCNLNCKGCYHFSPLAKEEYLSIDEFTKDIERIKNICQDRVSLITLLGGEPLLHPKITEFFDVTRKNFPNSTIKLLTNGTLFSKMDEQFWLSCRDNDITVFCTKYPINVNYFDIEAKAKEYSLKLMYHNDVNAGEKTLIKYPFDVAGSQSPEWNYPRCSRSNNCITLKHGRMFTCPMAAHAHLAKEYFNLPIELSEKDSIDIYSDISYEKLTGFLTKPIPFCRYCNLKVRPEQQKWEVSKKAYEEWF